MVDIRWYVSNDKAHGYNEKDPVYNIDQWGRFLPAVNRFLGRIHPRRSQRFRQAIGVLIRMIMEGRGWKKTGKKGSLGVRNTAAAGRPRHNSGGLAFWFLRAERYENKQRKSFASTRKRCRDLQGGQPRNGRKRAVGGQVRESRVTLDD